MFAAPTLASGSDDFKELSHIDRHLLAALPAPSADRLWVQVRQPVLLEDLARDLQISSSVLAELNDVEAQHRFDRGDWVVLPSKQSRVAKQLAVLDTSQLRRTPPPLMAPPPVQTTGVVRLGETLLQVAQRYGTTMQELVRLNPGLKTAGLVAGTEVRLPQRAALGLKPAISGGLSWPELPGFGGTPNSNTSTASPKRPTSADIASEIHRRRWAGFVAIGSCSYDWSGWKLDARGVRSTRYRCSYDSYRDDKWIAVDCKSLKTAKNFSTGWSTWKLPSDSDEVSVVARLCANTVGGTPKAERRQQVVDCYPSDSLRCRIEALDRLGLE